MKAILSLAAVLILSIGSMAQCTFNSGIIEAEWGENVVSDWYEIGQFCTSGTITVYMTSCSGDGDGHGYVSLQDDQYNTVLTISTWNTYTFSTSENVTVAPGHSYRLVVGTSRAADITWGAMKAGSSQIIMPNCDIE